VEGIRREILGIPMGEKKREVTLPSLRCFVSCVADFQAKGNEIARLIAANVSKG
jgi:hypothetical protein